MIGLVSFKFYFDRDKEILLLYKVFYEGYEFNYFEEYNGKVIYRDVEKEREVFGILRSFGFEEINGKLYFFRDDDDVFRFFKYEIEKF